MKLSKQLLENESILNTPNPDITSLESDVVECLCNTVYNLDLAYRMKEELFGLELGHQASADFSAEQWQRVFTQVGKSVGDSIAADLARGIR